MFGISHAVQMKEALEFTYRVIVEVLVLGLLVVVYQVPGMRFRTAVVCEPGKM